MNVLLLGADGFLGRHLQIALETAGHTVRRGVHRPVRRADEIAVDYARDVDPGAWRGRLTGVDAVINTVGILREGRGWRFDAIHDQAPRALFAACREAGVRRVIQVSALAADTGAASRFHLSKRAADDYLATLDLEWVIVQPAFRVWARRGQQSDVPPDREPAAPAGARKRAAVDPADPHR